MRKRGDSECLSWILCDALKPNQHTHVQVHALRLGFGGGVHPAHGRFFGDLLGTVVFKFALLFAGSPEFREYMRMYCPANRLIQTIPGVQL